MNKKFYYYIEVIGACNLTCPSCPTGNFKEINNPRGLMKPELLNEIMEKAKSESTVTGVGLFNWAEPLLHPKIPQLVKIVQDHDVPCHLSSNLNIMKNIDALLYENPASLRISLSGFNQSVYCKTHRGGDIEIVKNNMKELASAIRRTESITDIHVLYHRYLGNLDDEKMMKDFSEDLGFRFRPVWAFMMPLEKIFAYMKLSDDDINLSKDDLETIDRLALPLKEALENAKKYNTGRCSLQEDYMSIDVQGNVQLCCAVYNLAKYSFGSFLSMSAEVIQNKKYKSKTCITCMNAGIPFYATYGSPDFDNIAYRNIKKYYSKLGYNLNDSNIEEIYSSSMECFNRYIAKKQRKVNYYKNRVHSILKGYINKLPSI